MQVREFHVRKQVRKQAKKFAFTMDCAFDETVALCVQQ